MPIDIGFIAFFAYGFWHGYSRGIITTVFNMAMYVFGFVLAFKMVPTTTKIMEAMFHSDNPSLFMGAFLMNLFLIMLILRYTAKGLEGAMRLIYIGLINQLAGGVVMGGAMVVVYSVLVWFAVKVQFVNEATIAESKSYSFLEPLPGKAKDFAIRMKPFALDVWGTSMNWMDRLDEYGLKRTDGQDKIYRPPDDPKAIESDPTPSSRKPGSRSAPIMEDSDGIEE